MLGVMLTIATSFALAIRGAYRKAALAAEGSAEKAHEAVDLATTVGDQAPPTES